MAQKTGFWRTVLSATGEHWRETLLLGGYTFLGLAPLSVGLLLLGWFSRAFALTSVAVHGEFALYSASIVAPLLYVLGRDRGAAGLPGKGVLQLLTVAILVLSIAAYAPIATALQGTTPPEGFDAEYYSWSTVVLFIMCSVLFVAVTLVDNARQAPPVQEMTEKTYDTLEKNFDDLGDK